MERVFESLEASSVEILANVGSKSPCKARAFKELIAVARAIAIGVFNSDPAPMSK